MPKDTQKKSTQITANIGLYYVCYQLSRRGWNVMPTARNARGIDIVAYTGSGKGFIGIQVKTLSGRLAASIMSSSLSASAVRCLNTCSHTPLLLQRMWRVCTTRKSPNRAGRSRQGIPAR